jgi:hypothetical protein
MGSGEVFDHLCEFPAGSVDVLGLLERTGAVGDVRGE